MPASQEEGSGLERLRTILNDISNNLHRPSTSILESIAEPTPLKIQRISVEDGTKMTPISSGNNNNNNKNSGGGGISNWMSWTLGRDKRKGSHPIPQHELRHGGLWARGQASSTTESSSSSASLTPSPHDQVTSCPMCLMTLFSPHNVYNSNHVTLLGEAVARRPGQGALPQQRVCARGQRGL